MDDEQEQGEQPTEDDPWAAFADPTEIDDPDYLKNCTHIFPEQIHEEYVRIAADLAYWTAQYVDGQKEHLRSKVDLDLLERELYPVVRQELEMGGSRVTEKMIDAGIGQSSVWVDAKRTLVNAEIRKLRMGAVVDAVRTKKDMLVSLGAHIRAEMAGDPVLREQSRAVSEKMGFGGR